MLYICTRQFHHSSSTTISTSNNHTLKYTLKLQHLYSYSHSHSTTFSSSNNHTHTQVYTKSSILTLKCTHFASLSNSNVVFIFSFASCQRQIWSWSFAHIMCVYEASQLLSRVFQRCAHDTCGCNGYTLPPTFLSCSQEALHSIIFHAQTILVYKGIR